MPHAIDSLGSRAAEMAMQGAADYIRRQGLTSAQIDVDALIKALKRIAPAAALRAMDDAREAWAANMPQVAQATFAATMMAAGIEAAKEILPRPPCQCTDPHCKCATSPAPAYYTVRRAGREINVCGGCDLAGDLCTRLVGHPVRDPMGAL